MWKYATVYCDISIDDDKKSKVTINSVLCFCSCFMFICRQNMIKNKMMAKVSRNNEFNENS